MCFKILIRFCKVWENDHGKGYEEYPPYIISIFIIKLKNMGQ